MKSKEGLLHQISFPPEDIATAPLFYECQNRRLTNWYGSMTNWVDATCIYNGICDHGIRHNESVSKIGHFLQTEILQYQLPYLHQNNIAIPNAEWDIILSPEFTFLGGMLHDIGYPFCRWSGYEAVDHPIAGAAILRNLADNVLPKWVESRDDREEKALEMLRSMKSLLIAGISATTESALRTIDKTMVGEIIHPHEFAGILIKVADNFTRYERNRIEVPGVKVPELFKENPYYYLANAVAWYSLIYDGDRELKYIVEINHDVMTFSRWKDEIRRYDKKVWQLVDNFAKLLGLRFSIEEEPENHHRYERCR